MPEPSIVTPQDAQRTLDLITPEGAGDWYDLNYTVATEPDRTRAAVVEALLPIRRYAEANAVDERACGRLDKEREWLNVLILVELAENGAPL